MPPVAKPAPSKGDPKPGTHQGLKARKKNQKSLGRSDITERMQRRRRIPASQPTLRQEGKNRPGPGKGGSARKIARPAVGVALAGIKSRTRVENTRNAIYANGTDQGEISLYSRHVPQGVLEAVLLGLGAPSLVEQRYSGVPLGRAGTGWDGERGAPS